MKKAMVFLFIIACILVVIPANSANALSLDSVFVTNDQHVDVDQLLEEGKSDGERVDKAILTNEYGEEYIVDVYAIETSSVGNTKAITYVTSTDENLIQVPNIASRANNNHREKWDSSYSVKAYITCYFVTKDKDKLWLLTKVTGGYTISDYSVSVTSQALKYGCSGLTSTNGVGTTQVKDQKPQSSKWSYNTGFTKYVVKNAGLLSATIGANNKLSLKRGSSKWTFTVTNNL